MQSVLQRIRTGLLELRTPSGLLYASPTFSQRLYLLWTFRHFRSLSRRVLNRRQQELIDRLSQTALTLERGERARGSIIGTVENVENIPIRTQPRAVPATDNLVEMPAAARIPVAAAVGLEATIFPQKRVENNVRPMPEPEPRIAEISARIRELPKPKKSLPPDLSIPKSLRLPPRKWLEWATGAALGAAMLGMIFYVTEMRPSSISAGSRRVATTQSESQPAPVAPLPSPVASVPEKVSAPAISQPARMLAGITTRPDASRTFMSRTDQPSAVAPELPSMARVQVTGAPARNFVYPESPNSALTGTVNLRALIGPDGLVKHVDVLSGKPALARPAIDAMRHWRYRPAQSDGQAAEAETRVTINFVGDDAVSIVFPPSRD